MCDTCALDASEIGEVAALPATYTGMCEPPLAARSSVWLLCFIVLAGLSGYTGRHSGHFYYPSLESGAHLSTILRSAWRHRMSLHQKSVGRFPGHLRH